MVEKRRPNNYRHIKKEFCEVCGFDQFKCALCTHHRDGDRTNKSSQNIQVLCLNCHAIIHFALNYIYKGQGKRGKDLKPRRRIGYYNKIKKLKCSTKKGSIK